MGETYIQAALSADLSEGAADTVVVVGLNGWAAVANLGAMAKKAITMAIR